MTGFTAELKRRKVIKSIIVYLICAWALIQVTDTIAPALNLPEWTLTLVIVLLAVSFPFVMVFSWFYQLTPTGIKREPFNSKPKNVKIIIISCGLILMSSISFSSYYLITEVFSNTPNLQPLKTSNNKNISKVKVVAVLPFTHDKKISKEPLANSFYKDLTHSLASVKGLEVISSGNNGNLKEDLFSKNIIQKSLDVEYFLEGEVQSFGADLRLTLSLYKSDGESIIWRKPWLLKADTASLVDQQQLIAEQLSDVLDLPKKAATTADKLNIPTDNFEAYSLYHLAQANIEKRTSKDISEAVELFKQSILLDPGYAQAHAGLAFAYAMQTMYGKRSYQEMLQLAMPAIQRALALSPRLSEGHSILGWLRYKNGDFHGSKASFLQAIALNDRDPVTFHLFATSLTEQGKTQESLSYRKMALMLDPLSVPTSNTLAEDLLALGEYQQSLEQYQYSLKVQPQSAQTFAHIANLCRTGFFRPDKAAIWLENAIKIDPEHNGYPAQLAETLLDLGLNQEAQKQAKRAYTLGASHYWPNRAMTLLSSDNQELEKAAFYGRNIIKMTNTSSIALSSIRNHKYSLGELAAAKLAYLEQVPELFAKEVALNENNLMNAIDLSLILKSLGEEEKANKLLNKALNQIDTLPRFGPAGFEIYDVFVWNLLGNKEKALSSFEQAVEYNWYQYWYLNQYNPNLQGLIKEPLYLHLMERVKSRVDELRSSYLELKGSDLQAWISNPC